MQHQSWADGSFHSSTAVTAAHAHSFSPRAPRLSHSPAACRTGSAPGPRAQPLGWKQTCMFYFQQHHEVFCSSGHIRTVTAPFLLPLQNIANIVLVEESSWGAVSSSDEGSVQGLYNKDTAHSAMALVLSQLKKK